MSDLIWTPAKPRSNVQISGSERVVVLVHHKTKRILCFARDDWFANTFCKQGYDKIPIFHAHEYDRWAKRFCTQAAEENEEQDQAYLEREDKVRKQLRGELIARLDSSTESADKRALIGSLRVLDQMQRRKQRYRNESFMAQQAFEQTKEDGAEELTKKLITNA